MLRVKVYKDGKSLHKVDVDKDEIIFGRERDADVQLSSQAVSRRHARLQRNDDGWQIADMGAANGVYVSNNGAEPERIVIHQLQEGDVIIIETFSVRIVEISENEAVAGGAGPAFDEDSLEGKRTQFISMVDVLETGEKPLVAPVTGEVYVGDVRKGASTGPTLDANTRVWWVRINSSSGHDRTFELSKLEVSVGTAGECEVQLPSGPARIALLEISGPTVSLKRVAKWPFPRIVIDGSPAKDAILGEGDSFEVGDISVSIHLKGAPS